MFTEDTDNILLRVTPRTHRFFGEESLTSLQGKRTEYYKELHQGHPLFLVRKVLHLCRGYGQHIIKSYSKDTPFRWGGSLTSLLGIRTEYYKAHRQNSLEKRWYMILKWVPKLSRFDLILNYYTCQENPGVSWIDKLDLLIHFQT